MFPGEHALKGVTVGFDDAAAEGPRTEGADDFAFKGGFFGEADRIAQKERFHLIPGQFHFGSLHVRSPRGDRLLTQVVVVFVTPTDAHAASYEEGIVGAEGGSLLRLEGEMAVIEAQDMVAGAGKVKAPLFFELHADGGGLRVGFICGDKFAHISFLFEPFGPAALAEFDDESPFGVVEVGPDADAAIEFCGKARPLLRGKRRGREVVDGQDFDLVGEFVDQGEEHLFVFFQRK